MWTPGGSVKVGGAPLKCGVDYDIEIPRVGYSGVPHPIRDKAKETD